MKYLPALPLLCLSLALPLGLSAPVAAADFFVFPIREIEGLKKNENPAESRPLIDPRAKEIFSQESQKQVIESFTAGLANAYPSSIVHASQVRDAIKGKYQYQTNSTGCGEGFVAPMSHSYAVVAGVTRASYYEVDRGDNIEILVPVTMNIQLIKPERAKIVSSASSTQYTPFVISKKELNTQGIKDFMTKSLTANTITQMNELIDNIKKNFDPKDTPVKIIDKTGGFLLVDKGYEVGFRPGDELEAQLSKKKEASPLIFKVMSVDSGYSVLKAMSGSPSAGEEYIFVFESPADDPSKPKLMPVSSNKKDQLWSPAVADLFVKDIGYKAPFQLTPVDVNFNDTMTSVTAQANCAPWDKFPSAKTVFDSRLDHPNFFLRFEMGQSPVFSNSRKSAAKSEESFMTALTAQVVDKDGNVIFSEIGKDTYVLELVGKQGLSLPNAKEISLKNASLDLMKNFLKSVKLDPKQYEITDVKGGKFTVKGLEVPAGQNAVYEVLRPLGVNIQSKPAYMRLVVEQGANLPVSAGGATTFSYAMAPDYPNIKSGDVLRVLAVSKGNTPELSACGSTFVGKDSLMMEHVVPIVNHVAYQSSKFIVSISNPDFYEDANRLLQSGFFKFRMPQFVPTEFCYKPGYIVKKNEGTCEQDICNIKFLTGVRIATEKDGVQVKEFAIGEQISAGGMAEGQINNLIGFKAMASVLNLRAELSKRFNSK
jgi:hypothetical protein